MCDEDDLDFFQGEIWRPVVGCESSYEVSNYGRVRSIDREWQQLSKGGTHYTYKKTGKILRPGLASNGYWTVMLGREEGTRTVHSLVADAFIGPCPPGEEVRHKDDNRRNPALTNLEYGTRKQNVADMYERNRQNRPIGEASGASVLTEEQVLKIRSLYETGLYSYRELGELFECGKSTVKAIITRKTWTHI